MRKEVSTGSKTLNIVEIARRACHYDVETGELSILNCQTARCGASSIDQKSNLFAGGFVWGRKFEGLVEGLTNAFDSCQL